MTLQVGFVGSDGFLIASDRKAVAGVFPSMQHNADTRKIIISESGDCACAVAGDEFALTLANDLLSKIPQGHFLSDTEVRKYLDCAHDLCNEIYSSKPKESPLLILGFADSKIAQEVSRLWRIVFDENFIVGGTSVNKTYGGHVNNPALFWGERYYNQDSPLGKLKFIAAHIILEGGILNPTYIGGLDMLIVESGKAPRFLDKNELDELRARSVGITDKIKEILA